MIAPASTGPAPGLLPSVRRLAARHPWLLLAGLLFAGLLAFLPAARAELTLDDYLHASMIDGTYPARRGPLDLYDFVGDAERAAMMERGMLPWWSHPRLRLRFLRPLPSALRWGEQRLFGRSPALPHLHSLLWWAAAVLAARRLFRRVLAPRPALFATAMFALSPAHALPIAWLANREALISLTLGTLGLTEYLRWQERGAARHALAAAALFALSMTGGEYALCLGGYVLALELLGAGRPLARRALGAALYGVPLALYLGVRAALGFGTRGSGFYLDPLQEPLAFLHVVPGRLAALIVQQWLTLDGDTIHDTSSPWLLVGLLGAGVALLAVPVRRTLGALPAAQRPRIVALFAGAQLALLPVLAVDPSPRVLGASLLGLAPTLALLLERAWFPAVLPERRGVAELSGLAALAVGFAQLVHGPVTAWLIGEHTRQTSVDFARHVAELRERMPDPDHTDLLVVRGFNSAFFMPFALAADGRPPRRWRVLATTGHVLSLRRGPRTLELVAPRDQSMFSWDLFRDMNATVREGEVFDTPGLRATILEVSPAGPRRVRFDFDRDLDAPGNLWVVENGKGEYPLAVLPQLGFGQPFEP